MTTQLTWEPRRLRLHAARTGSAAILAFGISFLLQVVFLASFVPSVIGHGTAQGVDARFWFDLAVAMGRFSAITATAAVLAVALATIARNTTFAIISVFAWLSVIEPLLSGLSPRLGSWLWSENFAIVISWGQPPGTTIARGPLVALAVLAAYTGAVVIVSAMSFQRRDIATG